MLYGYIIILCLIMVLLGYATGRRIGIKEGFQKGLCQVPLDLKLAYFETSKCPICTKEQGKNYKGGKG